MAMGRRKSKQAALWVTTEEITRPASHPFYAKLNEVLDECRFDERVEHVCERFYKPVKGRPSIAPGAYFRALLVGFCEGIDSERGIAWRLADSLSLREFLGFNLGDRTPDHSTLSRTRRLLPVETHRAVFGWVVLTLGAKGLLLGQTVGIDATTLEANAAMRSIVRRDTGAKYVEYLTGLAAAAGIENPTPAQLARLDRKRKKTASNKDWKSPADPDSRIAKMKDGSTHLAHKAEHAVDLDSGALVAVTLQAADQGDTTTVQTTLAEARANVEFLTASGMQDVVADKGYHSGATLAAIGGSNVQTYIPEPERGRRNWSGREAERNLVYANRRRVRSQRGRRLLKLRSELVERSFAHMYDTGGMRRTHLQGRNNILKRLLLHAAAFNLALLVRKLHGIGKPRTLQGASVELANALLRLWTALTRLYAANCAAWEDPEGLAA
jgi:transposase